jgi:hypothetical protein
LILNGWLENQSQLTLVGSLFGFRVAVRCQVKEVTDSAVLLLTADGGRLAVDLSIKKTVFRYSDPRELPEIESSSGRPYAKKISSSVTILFPSRALLDAPDDIDLEAESLSVIEMIE